MATVKIILESEVATSDSPARVLVYDGEKLIAVVIAEIHPQKGADGGLYPCVTLKKGSVE